MTQTIPATAVLGPGKTGLAIGYRILDIDRVVYSAFTTTSVVETSTAGTYSVAGGVVAERAGGYIIWGEAGDDLAEDEIGPACGVYYEDLLQGVADALLLAPSAGDPAAGSAMALLTMAAAGGAGSGSTEYSNTITDPGSNPLDGVEVWITSDSGGASTVASTTSDTLGGFTVYLDPGTYYLWLAKGGYNFPNPTTITVS